MDKADSGVLPWFSEPLIPVRQDDFKSGTSYRATGGKSEWRCLFLGIEKRKTRRRSP